MSDPRLHSLHLEGQPRRDTFRSAREKLQAACGSQTMAGNARVLDDAALVVSTLAAPVGGAGGSGIAGRFTFYLKDGTNVYPLHLGMNSIGRLPDNDVVVRDECVSRRHCAVLIHSDLRCELHDVASKNGTLLNGKKIPQPQKLQSGDQITLCNRRLTFHMVEAANEPAAS
ncbi:regulator : FHA domain containing protein OS=Thermosediminibacter oceani (strain ATCC BAA-1034 / DSM 16646 / JW/IW-1228P) GN=Toce_0252 PE=4 SV=1: FHA [Gemmata massiliana]|uniref:FHA domain-containing protein n=1 Tax=Gemmata massiliana TaxID=1210884 RepID=A0A6P2CT05_9BACT|nr:FHA domain-containing protein [Gemmata massiliana]VTR92248.1 regulator : FHA domain containing protein OS=Thermosediminibacter oceani (strain ATCC BAA-1034 / DSM 16646 / JW/IW-1228P) GN=Toce_0252 PE=4 SV=1: FHA [Gemmata massiliana]